MIKRKKRKKHVGSLLNVRLLHPSCSVLQQSLNLRAWKGRTSGDHSVRPLLKQAPCSSSHGTTFGLCDLKQWLFFFSPPTGKDKGEEKKARSVMQEKRSNGRAEKQALGGKVSPALGELARRAMSTR